MKSLRSLIELLLNYLLNTRNTMRYIGNLHLSASYVANATPYLRPHVAHLRATHGTAHTGRQVSVTHGRLPCHLIAYTRSVPGCQNMCHTYHELRHNSMSSNVTNIMNSDTTQFVQIT
ncbi:Replicative DNA helicase [Gossypium arboreum]|uniref:Replicative DNA helicase n=1 Tax=Gossypium arboreum TaxID=29729 RepID=A0A0B0PQ97_GOSAR|nr:Replicative DNA helicase [Gossypium arboreum]